MLANNIIRCLRCGSVGHNCFQCRRAMGHIWCYRCKEYGHKAYNCTGFNRSAGQFRNRNNTNRTTFNRQNNNRGNQNANAESRPALQPQVILPSSKQLTQQLESSMPGYIPLDVWNPYINFPTAHHVRRKGQWWVNRSSFEIDKYYREMEENEEVVADARRRGVPHGKVTDDSDRGYEGENPASLFKALGISIDDNDQVPTVSCAIVSEGSSHRETENKLLAQNRSKRTQKWSIRPKIRQTYRRAKTFHPYGLLTQA